MILAINTRRYDETDIRTGTAGSSVGAEHDLYNCGDGAKARLPECVGGVGIGGEMIYIGIDPSLTGTGIVVLDEQGNVLDKDLISTKASQKIEDRLQTIWNRLKYIIWDFADKPVPDCPIAVEGLSFGSKGASMLELAGLHYLIRYMIDREFCGVRHVVPPQTLKKFVCGKGNVKKEQMLLQTYKRWGMEFQDNNICDAYCLARYAMENDAIRE